ncbi:MAG: DegT/DnrJ/EryC1/StrS family aminotransferase [Nitrososphaeria archaeon]
METRIAWDIPDISDEEIKAVTNSISSRWVGSNGELVRRFEKDLSHKLNVKYTIAVNNGTSALLCALLAMKEINPSLIIGVPTFTFIATANTASFIGDEVKFIDCSRETWNISAENIPRDINLIIPVDVGGLPVDYDSIKDFNIPIISDSAESMGSKYKGKLIGSQADIHVFSFHRAKIVTTGEGGAITTNNKELYEIMWSICNHGYDPSKKPWQYRHIRLGFNFRMTELEAAVGIEQLKKLEKYVKERNEKAEIYKDIIGDKVDYQQVPKNCVHNYFFFGIVLKEMDVDEFCLEMWKRNIEVKSWTPCHLQKHMLTSDKFENAEWLARRVALLPIHNKLKEEDVKKVAENVINVIEKR